MARSMSFACLLPPLAIAHPSSVMGGFQSTPENAPEASHAHRHKHSNSNHREEAENDDELDDQNDENDEQQQQRAPAGALMVEVRVFESWPWCVRHSRS